MFSFKLRKSDNICWTAKEKEHNKAITNFLENILGCRPGNILLYNTALIHRSRSHRSANGYKINNERLEYLGDTVLNTIVGEFLFRKYPHHGEGFLTEMRAKIVSRKSLNALSKKIGLTQLIDYNRRQQGGIFSSMPGDAFEAIVGALYLDKGYKRTYKILTNKILTVHLDVEEIETTDWNYKSKILSWGQKTKRKITFHVCEVTEKKGQKLFKAEVVIDNRFMQSAVASSIKLSEQLAAERTFKTLVDEGVIDIQLFKKAT